MRHHWITSCLVVGLLATTAAAETPTRYDRALQQVDQLWSQSRGDLEARGILRDYRAQLERSRAAARTGDAKQVALGERRLLRLERRWSDHVAPRWRARHGSRGLGTWSRRVTTSTRSNAGPARKTNTVVHGAKRRTPTGTVTRVDVHRRDARGRTSHQRSVTRRERTADGGTWERDAAGRDARGRRWDRHTEGAWKRTAGGKTWESSTQGTTRRGQALTGEASGELTRNADGSKTITRERTVTRGGKTTTVTHEKTVKKNADGSTSWESSTQRTDARGRTSTRTTTGTARKTASGREVTSNTTGTRANGTTFESTTKKTVTRQGRGKQRWERNTTGRDSSGKQWTTDVKGERVARGDRRHRVVRTKRDVTHTVNRPGKAPQVRRKRTRAVKRIQRRGRKRLGKRARVRLKQHRAKRRPRVRA